MSTEKATATRQLGKVLETFHLYATRSRLYLVGCNHTRSEWQVLKFIRGPDLDVSEDCSVYTEEGCNRLLQEIQDGNCNVGGLRFLCSGYGLAGCVKFLEGYYLLFISERRLVGQVCNDPVYGLEHVKLQPILPDDWATGLNRVEQGHEQRYQKLLMQVLENKELFFSYTYNLHQSLQDNMLVAPEGRSADAFDSMFVWNHHITKDIRSAMGNDRWVLPLVHGFWQQRTFSVMGKLLRVTLIARRSRHFAGTRFRKRGVNKQGYVANEVETEQVIDGGGGWGGAPQRLSSVVQVRGSIPIFWSQDEATLTAPKPDITVQHFDPLFTATRLHFQGLAHRYGCPAIVLNLVKKFERARREAVLGDEFQAAVDYLNAHLPEDEKIVYIPFDFRQMAGIDRRLGHTRLIANLSLVAQKALKHTGVFSFRTARRCATKTPGNFAAVQAPSTMPSLPSVPGSTLVRQAGVLRTNCIDCLDRTNIAQFAYGLVSLSHQLGVLGVTDGSPLDMDSSMALELGHMCAKPCFQSQSWSRRPSPVTRGGRSPFPPPEHPREL
mmetsp:Transcript_42873/g.101784  ORF Transcript_42873/g.101784 Transcript_42873/m.101784 type:complete len:551 (-) Transcript_42873:1495-3147(-)